MAQGISNANVQGIISSVVSKTENGTVKTRLQLAVTTYVGEGQTDTQTVIVYTYGKLAERVAQMKEGTTVLVSGEVQNPTVHNGAAFVTIDANAVYEQGAMLISFSGNLGNDPTLNHTANGTAVMNFNVAVTRYAGKNSDGSTRENTVWVRCTLWEKRAESLQAILKKGDPVVVSGIIKSPEVYTNNQGQPASSVEVTVKDIAIYSRNNNETDPLNNGGAPQFPANPTNPGQRVDDIPF